MRTPVAMNNIRPSALKTKDPVKQHVPAPAGKPLGRRRGDNNK